MKQLKLTAFGWSVVLFLLPFNMQAQMILPSHILAHRMDSVIYIRWEPVSIKEWQAGLVQGFNIELLDVNRNVLERKLIRPLDPASFNYMAREAPVELIPFYNACADLLYPGKSGSSEGLTGLMNNMIKSTEETIDSFRLSMISYYSSYKIDLAQANGLGTSFLDPHFSAISCRISVSGFDSKEAEIFQQPLDIVPSLVGNWGDRIVQLQWEVEGNYKHIIGYQLERSVDGVKFFPVFDLPVLDPAVGLDGNKANHTIGIQDSLALNYKDYYYRLKTVDYYGNVSKPSPMIKGYGFKGLSGTPQITYADQDKDNRALLKWNVDQAEITKIESIVIVHSNQMDANYQPLDTFDSNTRQASIPMAYDVNYYRIELIPFDGPSVSSFPVFVMGIDTIAPIMPEVIGGTIDTLGRIVIQWRANKESDLWGYRVFRANFETDEFALQTATPIVDSFFVDSVSLRLGTKNVYYVIQSLDKRNNRSPFTEPIILAKPDIIPPSSPIVDSIVQVNDSIKLFWTPGESDDIIKYQLFRRLLDSDEKWKLVVEIDTSNIHWILDAGLQVDYRYAYSMRAMDDAGLFSEMSPVEVVYMTKPKVNFLPDIQTAVQFDPIKNEISLTWASNEPERISSVLVYRGWEPEKLGKYKYGIPGEGVFKEVMAGPLEVYYKVKLTYNNDPTSYFSETVHISIPKTVK